mgnify:FL=1
MTGHNRYRKMSNKSNLKSDPSHPIVYQIRIKGHLGRQWTEWFDGLTITPTDDGNTLLSGGVIDQAALHGVFKKIRNLGLAIMSVNPQAKEGEP